MAHLPKQSFAWILAVLALAALLVGATLFSFGENNPINPSPTTARQGPSTAAMGTVLLSDNFTRDSSLNASDWVTDGPQADASMADFGFYPVSAAVPSISFSPSDGLTLSGASANYTFVNVQAVQSFVPPFVAQTRVMATVSNGNPITFTVATNDGGQGINIEGNLNSTNPYYGMGDLASVGVGVPWEGVGSFTSTPQLNTWYTLSIAVNSTGIATATMMQGTTLVGSNTYYLGLGTYYVFLGQVVDAPPANGVNSASWTYVDVNSTPVPPPAPQVVGAIADPAYIQIGDSTQIDVFVTGGAPPLTVSYSGLPPGCVSSSTFTLVCVPTAVGNYHILATVSDALSRTSTGEANLSVSALPPPGPPHIDGVVADPSTLSVGASTTIYVIASGGDPPLTVSYTSLPPGCTSASTLTLVCTPSETGSYAVSVTVTDAQDRASTGEVNLTITASKDPTVAPLSPDLEAALALGAIAVVLGLAALIVSRRRRNPPATHIEPK